MMISTTSKTKNCGNKGRTICAKLTFAIEEVTNKQTPSGGVIMPIVRLTTMMTPK